MPGTAKASTIQHPVKAYLAGTGVTTALLAAALIAFLAVAAIVAFNFLPSGPGDSDDSTVFVGPEGGGAPAAAAAAVGAAPGAVAAAPAAGPSGGAAGGGAAGAPPGGATAPPGDGGGEPIPGPGGTTTPPGGGGGEPVPVGPTAGLVNEADQTVQGTVGVNPGLGETTKPLTDVLDQTLEDTLPPPGEDLGGKLGLDGSP